MFFVLVELDFFAEVIYYSVNTHADISVLFRAFEFFDKLTFFAARNRCHNLNFSALWQFEHAVNDIIYSLPRYLSAADWTVRNAYAGIEQAQIVIYLRHRSDG